MKITVEIQISKAEYQVIKNEAERLKALGYKVPDIIVKFLPHAYGMAGLNEMYISTPSIPDLELLRFTVAHEIGHHNEPEQEFDFWTDELDFGKERQASEDFANWFAVSV